MLTDNKILTNAAQKNYDNFKVPTCMVNSKKKQRHYTNKDKSDLDIKTSDNKIGDIVNLSQYLNSILWQNINNGQTIEQNKELYFDICKLAVLSGIEIDRAKKEYKLSSGQVINELKEKYKIVVDKQLVKPMFFKMITLENGFELNKKHTYKYFKTPMDFLQKQISSFNFRENRKQKEKFLSFSEIVRTPDIISAGRYYEQRDRILELVTDAKNKISNLYCDYDKKNKDEKEIVKNEVSSIKQNCVEYINDLSVAETTMYLLLKSIEDNKHKGISKIIFTTLFGTPNKMFFKMIINRDNIGNELVENKHGDIKIFDYFLIKIAQNSQKTA